MEIDSELLIIGDSSLNVFLNNVPFFNLVHKYKERNYHFKIYVRELLKKVSTSSNVSALDDSYKGE